MELRTISVGDVHGNDAWKSIEVEKYDRIIFVGDYTDHWTRKDHEILGNLKAIIDLKKKYPDKVVLLMGNHDMQYLYPEGGFSCSGYRSSMGSTLTALFKQEKALFRGAYQIENYLWTHAGLSRGFYENIWIPLRTRMNAKFPGLEEMPFADAVQVLFENNQVVTLGTVGYCRGGDSPNGGIFWADKSEHKWELTKREILPLHQICGHSRVDAIRTHRCLEAKGSFTFIDCQDKRNDFHEEVITVKEAENT